MIKEILTAGIVTVSMSSCSTHSVEVIKSEPLESDSDQYNTSVDQIKNDPSFTNGYIRGLENACGYNFGVPLFTNEANPELYKYGLAAGVLAIEAEPALCDLIPGLAEKIKGF